MSSNYRVIKESLPLVTSRAFFSDGHPCHLQGAKKPCIEAAAVKVGADGDKNLRSYEDLKDDVLQVKNVAKLHPGGNPEKDVCFSYLSSAAGTKVVLSPPFASGGFGSIGPARVIGDVVDKIYAAKTISLSNDRSYRTAQLASIKNEVNLMMGTSSLAPTHVFDLGDKITMLMPAMHGDAFSFIVNFGGQTNADLQLRGLFTHVMIHEMSKALAFLHAEGITHRDVKLDNILFHSDGRLVLADFGLAAKQNLFSDIAGTRDYLSPEALKGAGHNRPYGGPKADIWALGVTAIVALMAQDFWHLDAWNFEGFSVSKELSGSDFAQNHLNKIDYFSNYVDPVREGLRIGHQVDVDPAASSAVTHILMTAAGVGAPQLQLALMMMELEPAKRPSAMRLAELSLDPCALPDKRFLALQLTHGDHGEDIYLLDDHLALPGMTSEQKATFYGALSAMPSDAKAAFSQARKSTAHLE